MFWSLMVRRVALLSAVLAGLAGGAGSVVAQTSAPSTPATAAPGTTPAPAPTPAAPAPAATPTPAAPAEVQSAPPPPTPGSTTPPPPAPSSAAPPPSPAPSPAPSSAAPAPSAPAPAPSAPDTGSATPDQSGPDQSISQTYELQSRPVVMVSGSATWDEGFRTVSDALDKLNAALAKVNLKAVGHPLALFKESDDAGFKYDAMIPIEKAPEGKPDVPAEIKFGVSPTGKVMKFQHRSAYDDIDSTYEAITAYLDEKGIDTKNNVYAEEYLNRTKTSDDPSLEVDILVFLK